VIEIPDGAQWTAQDVSRLKLRLDDPAWRLSNLYKIVTKAADDSDPDGGLVVTFKPNVEQQKFLDRLWYRNVVLKVRQRGFTTLISLLWLDTAMFSRSPIVCGTVAHTREAVEAIFRGKILFAYDRLPEVLRERFPLSKRTESQIVFGHNGANIKVAVSLRSDTIHRLHVSEYGKICAKQPLKAKEIQAGTFPAVPLGGITIIESTAEGQDGDFHDKTQRAIEAHEKGKKLTKREYRLHFASWYTSDDYRLVDDWEQVAITPAHAKYFIEVESKIGVKLSPDRRAWYVATLENDFNGDMPTMWQEYPSYPQEAFKVSAEGAWFGEQLALARIQGRVLAQLPVESVPVNTFWDLGRGDMTAIWLHQRVGPQNRFIGYIEASGEDLTFYVKELQKTGHLFGRHFLPHDASMRRMGIDADTNKTLEEMLQQLMPGQNLVVVPRVTNIGAGIQAVRSQLATCWFDETKCAIGLSKRLANYRKAWDKVNGRWSDQPVHDDASHGADAFRQFAQAAEAGETFGGGVWGAQRPAQYRRRPTSAMAV
jgi:hypothetical protein